MTTLIEDYALLSDMQTAALVGADGSIDWLCFPRFDSPAMFTKLLGTKEHGHWLLAPVDGELVKRLYRSGSFILDSHWETPTGKVTITEFMPLDGESVNQSDLVRIARCTEGTVELTMDYRLRFNYGESIPWMERIELESCPALRAIAGPNAVYLTGPLPEANGTSHHGTFSLTQGEEVSWDLIWGRSYEEPPHRLNLAESEKGTLEFWTNWSDKIVADGDYAPHIERSLLVLRALTDLSTGGIVAAPTSSLPEEFGGSRNWDYRYTWLRDSALTIEALIAHGFTEGADAWREWMLRAIAGDPHSLRIMYGIAGERHLPEIELDHLPGYEYSTPVRIGNGAAEQFQGDVVGEVMVALDKMRKAGVDDDERTWGLQIALLEYAAANLDRPEHGIWEMRGELAEFTHSRAMMWAAFDCGIKAVEDSGFDGPIDEWREIRDRLEKEIEERGWNDEIKSYTQTYGSTEVDASLLQLAQIGYLAYDDERMLSTVARLEKDLQDDEGFLYRYRTESGQDGLDGDEYPFLICTFWLVEQYAMSGRVDDAKALMDKLVGVASPLGLLAEEYSTEYRRLAGNYPQAFSHLGLIRAADAIAGKNPGRQR